MQEYDPLDSPVFDIVKAAQAGRIGAGIDLVKRKAAENPGQVNEGGLNNLGYGLMNGGRLDDAIKVFELNAGLFPQSGNVFDSLAEALEKRGDVDGAIRNYELSLKYDPRNDNAKRRLESLRKKK
jgi:tetratricopeptide (TPR) repeat protein